MFSTFSEYTRAFHILFHPHDVWNPSGTEIAAVRQQNFNGYTATTGKNSPSLFFSFVRHLCSSTLGHLLSNIRWTSHRHQCLTRMPVVDVVLVHLDMCWLLCDPTVRRVTWLHSRFGFSLPRTKSRKSPMCSSYFKPFHWRMSVKNEHMSSSQGSKDAAYLERCCIGEGEMEDADVGNVHTRSLVKASNKYFNPTIFSPPL